MRLLTLIVMLGVATTANAEGWLCISDAVSGFRYDKTTEKWKPTTFAANGKYVIKPRPATDTLRSATIKWHVVEVGDEHPTGFCEAAEKDWLVCDGLVGAFKVRLSSLRFTHINTGFYYIAPKEMEKALIEFGGTKDSQPDDVVMEVGRCTTL